MAETIPTKLIPLTQWNEHHSYPPTGQLRWLVFNEKTNGFHHCIRRVGRRVLIDERAFFEWVEQQNPPMQGSTPSPATSNR